MVEPTLNSPNFEKVHYIMNWREYRLKAWRGWRGPPYLVTLNFRSEEYFRHRGIQFQLVKVFRAYPELG